MVRDMLDHFRAYMRAREASFLTAPVKITAKKSIPEAKLTTFSMPDVKEGNTIEVPRWVAEVLEEEGLAERAEESVEAELYRALQREKLQGSTQLSPIRGDFYLKLRRYLMALKKKGEQDQHYQKVLTATTSLMTMRLVKMVTLAGYTSQPEPHQLLSPEELTLFRQVKSIISLWRETITGSD